MEKLSNKKMNLLKGGTSQSNSEKNEGYVYVYIGGGVWIRVNPQR